MSMGGFVVVSSAIRNDKLADGVVLLAPMLSLNKLAQRGINKILLPPLDASSRVPSHLADGGDGAEQ